MTTNRRPATNRTRRASAAAHAAATTRDALGVTIVPGDSVRVIAWGAPVRLIDTGRLATVSSITPRGLVALDALDNPADPIARGRSVSPGCLGVIRRDGFSNGLEGNVTR